MGILSVIAMLITIILGGAMVIGVGAVIAGFCVAAWRNFVSSLRPIGRKRQRDMMEFAMIRYLQGIRTLSNEALRVTKEEIIRIYRSPQARDANPLYCPVMCEIIDRLIAGKRMEDRDVRTIIETFEAWNGKGKEAVPTS